ncbi:hypothetical protein LXA43DRAFT_682552 [Ganoderma leucocontextum]|nr:hypothetical protein LXA43DRAFT_682552 [Ganoderma leucocontextum]
MTSHSDIDTLLATLHPHVFKGLFDDKLFSPKSLQPSDDTPDFRKLVQAFATLFSFHPGCDAAAVTAQTSQSGNTPLHICLSPSTPHGFNDNANRWFAQFMALRKEPNLKSTGDLKSTDDLKSTGDRRRIDMLSHSERVFVLQIYSLCYPAMRQRIINEGLGFWNFFANAHKPVTDVPALTPTEEEKQLREKYAEGLQELSTSVDDFIAFISHTPSTDDDMLQFHQSCLSIRNIMESDGHGVWRFLDEYVFPGGGADRAVEYLCLPIELSTLLDLSRRPSLALDGNLSLDVLDPSTGARKFSAVVMNTHLAERFEDMPGMKWEDVMCAFEKSAARPNGYGMGYKWNTDKNILSTAKPVTVHPEITLIQHLLENGDGNAEAYIACSRTPCYASALYAVAVNQTLQTRFTMRVDNPDWCRLYTAEAWVLPKDTEPEVMATMKKALLQDLRKLVYKWVQERRGV